MQWHMPIGYNVKNGKIKVHEKSGKVVEQIFRDYDAGIAAIKIASDLKERGIKNAHDRVAWTHASIGRILENQDYLGTEYYTQIIDTELFERVQKRREQTRKNLGHGEHRPGKSERLLFGGILTCAVCDTPYSHIQPKHKKRKQEPAQWKCKNDVYHNSLTCAGGFISDEQAKKVCIYAINQIIRDKRLIMRIEEEEKENNPQIRELDRRIEDAKAEQTEEVMALIFERAAKRYNTLRVRDNTQKTNSMLEFLEGKQELEEFEEDRYRELIRQMKVYKDNSVEVVFTNGSSIKVEYE